LCLRTSVLPPKFYFTCHDTTHATDTRLTQIHIKKANQSMRSVFELAGSAAMGVGVLSNLLSLLFVQGPRQRTQGRRECLPATTCQRSVRASYYGVRSQFWPRGRDTLSA